MSKKISLLVLITLLLQLAIGIKLFPEARAKSESRIIPAAYIEPGLASETEGDLSVIVTAASFQQAVQAVKQVGGKVTSDLWLIQAAGALIPADRLEELAAQPGVRSIVNNKQLEAADKKTPATPTPTPSPTPVPTSLPVYQNSITTDSASIPSRI